MKTTLLFSSLSGIWGACTTPKDEVVFETAVAKNSLNPMAYYDLQYLQIQASTLSDSVWKLINKRIADECKLLINGNYMSPQDSIWKRFERKSVQNVA